MTRVCLVLFGLLCACDPQPVGQICRIPGVTGDAGVVVDPVVISSPAVDCEDRMCLHTPLERPLPPGGRHEDMCTDLCEDDGDCPAAEGSPCQGGFTCAVAQVVGPFACQKVCVCKDYVVLVDGGIPTPAACGSD